jgi:hypothetical protein
MRFAAPLCDPCAVERMQYAAIAKAAVSLDPLVNVPLVTSIEGIDLVQLTAEVLDGVVGDHAMTSVENVPGTVSAVAAVLDGKLRRALLPSEQAAVINAARGEFIRRQREKRANLRHTQSSLASPFSVFQRRVG